MSISCALDGVSSKPQARKALVRWCAGLSGDERASRAQSIARRVTEYLISITTQTAQQSEGNQQRWLGVYWPIRTEPDLRSHYEQWVSLGWQLALPVTPSVPGPLRFVHWQPGEPMARDAMGIAAPVRRQHVEPDVLIIPCLGYGPDALRLGYGGGYYDRTLAERNHNNSSDKTIISLGVAYAGAYLPALEAQTHDCLLTTIITDQGRQGGA
ncbi:MAG: 5-formyltetrahydrofolate cyclo-ligase [Burkholderiaceae bacterium]